jgi:Flp pilus assembly protein TadG
VNRTTQSCFRQVLRDKRSTVAILAALGVSALVGLASLSVDVGYILTVKSQLQASSTAAALAAVKDIGVGGTPIATATLYSSVTATPANKNNIAGVTTVMAEGYPALKCFAVGPACSTNQTPATSANGIQVSQTATVPLIFAKLLGFNSVPITASAVALTAGQAQPPLNVMFITDATQSMSNADADCGSTKIQCAIQGFEVMLGELWPCTSDLSSCGTVTNHNVPNPVDQAGLIQFPGLQSAPPSSYSCAGLTTTAYAGIKGTTNATTASTSSTLHFATTPAYNTGSTALVTDVTHPTYIKSGTTISSTTTTTAVMSVTPTSGDTIASADVIDVWPPMYVVVPLSSDYKTSDAASTLNTSSDLVKCAESMTAPGGFGTFYADAINAAQSNLAANARTGARNVIIIMTDFEANGTTANMVEQGGVSTATNECKTAITAAQNAASAGTWVYTVSFGTSATGGCTTDTGSYANSCWVAAQMANLPGTTGGTYVNEPRLFYADNASGCASPSHPSITAINAIFQNIDYSLTTPRMIPNACLVSSPPGWC